MTIDNTKLVFNSNVSIDKILSVYSGSFLAPAGNLSAGSMHSLGVNDLVYFAGLFSVDGGAQQDLGGQTSEGSTKQVWCWGKSTNGEITIEYWNTDSSEHTVAYEIAIISKPSNTLYTPTSQPNNQLYLSSNENMQKIAFDKTIPLSITGNYTYTAAHNLGYRPCVRAFLDNGSVLIDAIGSTVGFNIGFPDLLVSVDNTNVYFIWSGVSSTYNLNLNYRIYYDPN
jgi:hypothetical protein